MVEHPYGYATSSPLQMHDAVKARETQSEIDAVACEKILSHLCGRVQELRARLDHVLLPPHGVVGVGNTPAEAEPRRSSLALRTANYRNLAQAALGDIEDILNRLDL
jgi:hypothetical protein